MTRRALFVTVVCLQSTACLAIRPQFPLSWYVPFDRLIANTEAFVKDHPNDPQGYYTLARIHYFIFVNRYPLIPTLDPNNGLFYLGLASLYDDYLFYTADANITSPPRNWPVLPCPEFA